MKHINEIELIEYVAENLTEPKTSEIREHLAACKECSARLREATETWNTLGEWSVETAGHDVSETITNLVEKAEQKHGLGEKTRILRTGFLRAALRIAASILIAIGVGHRLGKYSVTGQVKPDAASKSRPEYLAAFGLKWSSELAWLILEDESSNTEQER